MKLKLIAGLLLLSTIFANAKLGDTREQTEQNWGAPVSTGDISATYQKGALTLTETYNQDGKAISAVYSKAGNFTDEEFAKVSAQNVPGLKPVPKRKAPIDNPTLRQLKKVKTANSSTYLFKTRQEGTEYIVQQVWPKGAGTYIVGFYTSECPIFDRIKTSLENEEADGQYQKSQKAKAGNRGIVLTHDVKATKYAMNVSTWQKLIDDEDPEALEKYMAQDHIVTIPAGTIVFLNDNGVWKWTAIRIKGQVDEVYVPISLKGDIK
jgi:hypothetical protein